MTDIATPGLNSPTSFQVLSDKLTAALAVLKQKREKCAEIQVEFDAARADAQTAKNAAQDAHAEYKKAISDLLPD